MKTVKLFDLNIYADKKSLFLEEIANILVGKSSEKKNFLSIFTPNPEQLVQAEKDKEFQKNLQKADILLPDGAGLLWASRILNKKGKLKDSIEERITGVELVEYLLLSMKQNSELKALIIGGREYSFSKNSDNLSEVRKNLFWTEAYLEKELATEEEEGRLVKIIKELKPDIIFVALGAPHQEKWIIEHADLMKATGVKFSLAVGGSFDFIFGKLNRSPKWIRNFGFEWLYRLGQEPWRWRRQLRLIEFAGMVWRKI